ncbi:erythromycin esterase family protein [Kribbella sp. NBC_01245]|uniref:erythromycin esterase family protein n=1 Tax=Kribbella sp. NBC_01245 TaxID=2903578 RepID=UPI002E291F21|nr:erythromycin esterase family protein [Kribbella sp. NBC_01245]
MSVTRRLVAAAVTLLSLALVATPVQAATDDPLRALDRHAQPILGGLERSVGKASIVGVGEATHSSHEFFTIKHRIFRKLVERKGFKTFALEVAWSTGLRLNDYVLQGKGDPADILRAEDQVWATREYVDLLKWMRAYNRSHSAKLQFMGNDPVYPGTPVFAEVTRHVGPALLQEYQRLQTRLRLGTTQADAWRDAYTQRPLAERKALAADAASMHAELARVSRNAWAVQNALIIAQTLHLLAFDFTRPEQEAPRAMLFRDRAMADNVTWWHRYTGEKIVLSAHNGHIGYVSADPYYPKLQGAFLRDQLGRGYVNIGLSFNRGGFNAQDDDGNWRVFRLGAAPAGYNEHTLDQVRYRDFLIDTRTVPAAARRWLDEARLTRDIGTAYPDQDLRIALGRSYDLVIHIHRVTPARLLDGPSGHAGDKVALR